ncbi:hypothetical protein M8C21_028231 [Ambrosia artemisiifolia]|uniref:Uncharacterized protein n=1 Tax=Ambrosia artemisiifolia TaxID=4212 RepID=A0AAD5CVU3_AMBAR|nr:hypothetical protein M8C21_028231 [Ambrosia artemisiifolia]
MIATSTYSSSMLHLKINYVSKEVSSRFREGGLAEEKDVKAHEPDQQTDLVSNSSFASLNLNSQKLKQVALSDNKTKVSGSRGCGTLVFEFMEPDGPYTRKPLSVQASILGSVCPKLNKYRSCDLLP